MSLRINQNVPALNTYSLFSANQTRLEKSLERLSSGLRINTAADDPAGLSVSERLRMQFRGLSRAASNAQDAVSFVQTAEGSLEETESILQRMRELALESGNDTYTSNDRLEMQKEIDQLKLDLDRISANTEFNTRKLLDGSQAALVSANSSSVRGFTVGNGPTVSGDYQVSITLLSGGISQMQRSQIFTLKSDSSTLAQGDTKLEDIGQLYNANGAFALGNPQMLTIGGNSKSTTITIDGQTTLNDLAAALQSAMAGSSGLEISNSRAGVVGTAQTGLAGQGGYIQLTSGIIGDYGTITISGEDAMLTGLGMSTLRDPQNNQVEITSRDAFGNTKTVRTASGRASGLLDGIDMQFSSQPAQIAGTQGIVEGLHITADNNIAISANGISLNVVISGSADSYWTLEGVSRSINAQAAGVMTGLTSTVDNGQIRLDYSTTSGTTFSLTVAGEDTLGLTTNTFTGFTIGQKDTAKVENGFTRYIATGGGIIEGSTAAFTVYDGNAAGGAIDVKAFNTLGSGSATISDMVSFANFQASVNAQLNAAGVEARIDQIGSAFAFTALRVGNENPDGASPIKSMISLSVTATDTLMQSTFLNQFGISAGSARGSGDKNFSVHIINTNPQFQIGAGDGQNMKVAIANMGSAALGVDNVDVTTTDSANTSLGKISTAIDRVSSERAKLGAYQGRLEYAINNLNDGYTNTVSAESRIRDVDFALEMIEFTRSQIIAEADTAMLAQANLMPQSVLKLLENINSE